jgi:hypothetical protein
MRGGRYQDNDGVSKVKRVIGGNYTAFLFRVPFVDFCHRLLHLLSFTQQAFSKVHTRKTSII